jgi:hypothetical protein
MYGCMQLQSIIDKINHNHLKIHITRKKKIQESLIKNLLELLKLVE